jgi:hypothetical protein
MTGKSPSTTGAGSEGALTKGPFNALCAIHDLNAFMTAGALTGSHFFVTSAGYVGPNFRVDHDISLLVPEIWARMTPQERTPEYLQKARMLENCAHLDIEGLDAEHKALLPLLGHRINRKFVNAFFGRVFNNPELIFEESMLKPELQDVEIFKEGLVTIAETIKRVSAYYFEDGSVAHAVPPLRALLEIMHHGKSAEGWTLSSPEFRALFTRDAVLASAWYRDRLSAKRKADTLRLQRNIASLEAFLANPTFADEAKRLGIEGRLDAAKAELASIETQVVPGMIGLDPALL